MTPNLQWKMIYLARRNPALAPEDFPQAWREHSALGRQCRNVHDKVRAVRQCSRVINCPAEPQGTSLDYDGVNLMWLRDRAAADDIWNDEETLRIMKPDEPRVFSTYVRNFTLVAQEQVVLDGDETGICLIIFLRAKPGQHLQLPIHGEALIAQLTAPTRLVWNQVESERPSGYEYDAIVEIWYESLETVTTAFTHLPVWQYLPAAIIETLDIKGSVCLLTQVTHRRP